jgi:hypothetical protein
MLCAYTSDVEEILKFKTLEGFEEQIAFKKVSS